MTSVYGQAHVASVAHFKSMSSILIELRGSLARLILEISLKWLTVCMHGMQSPVADAGIVSSRLFPLIWGICGCPGVLQMVS